MPKLAFVTGASEGIGFSIAKKLAASDFVVVGVARDETKLKALMQVLGPAHRYVVADLATEVGQQQIVNELLAEHCDLLVNNAGVGVVGGFADRPIEQQVAMVQLNCLAVVRLSHAFLKSARKGDALVNVSSALAYAPMPGIGLYCATKSFITTFTETLWYEQKKKGIYVLALHPGVTATNFQVHAGGKVEDLPKGMAQTPDRVADVVIKALEARSQPSVISGVRNAIFAGMSRVLPRKSHVSMMGGLMGGPKPQ